MKKLRFLALALLTAALLPTYASADVANVGLMIAFGLLPYVLIAAIIVIAVVLIVKAVRRKKNR